MNNNHLDSCFIQAGKRYLIAPELLKTIAQQESGLVATAINHNKNKSGKIISTDYGIMQINSVHIPELKKLGVIKNKDELLKKPCLNIQTGAWILARHFQRCGVNWECLGSYNAGFSKNNTARRMIYARKIHNRYFRQY
ncbi:TPA: lytic transglycosylase domain-containing protein [Escherichia coli]|nr:lytic transglycosylase domain-containing protein [Escherichia coli]EGI4675246.1 lytic transglycosylase domain-containing protein [Escherichia coli]EGO5174544.1 lytic transglycosylase domain-containing protein [Escherichia coli]EHM0705083.1 lytic transglycosylase domain-containing protein [Escherichia coli]EIY9351189.1 lytic transglycosylase domain-containing protein [Escherichia coli]